MKVYLDNCSYNRPFDDQSQIRIHLETQAKLHIQKLITDGTMQLACSYISRYENGSSPHARNKTTIEKFFENAVSFVDIDKADIVGIRANEILKKYQNGDIAVCSPIEFINYYL